MVCGPIWPKFEFLAEILIPPRYYACPRYLKFKMNQINSNREKVATSIFGRSRAVNSVVLGQNLPNI